MKGVYCLITFLQENRKIKFGKNESFFKKGFYCYVGSALNNMEKRLERHFSKKKRKRWHIDYLLPYTKILGARRVVTINKIECRLSDKINEFSDGFVSGFGSSDCRCKSHLYCFHKNPLTNREFLKLFDLHERKTS